MVSIFSPAFLVASTSSLTSSNLGEALYRFLLSHSQTPPTLHLHLRGTHHETRTRIVTSHSHNGGHHGHSSNTHTHTETYTEVVTDFDFRINLTPNIITDPAHAPVQWSIPDDEPAYRGKVYKQVEVPGTPIGQVQARKADRRERKGYKTWCEERSKKGLPPWVGSYSLHSPTSSDALPDGEIQLKSSRTVRQWCDDYCTSNKVLKEFVYTKV